MSPEALISVAEHRSTILASLQRMEAVELLLDQCVGAALAAEVKARVPVPTFTNSSMDGYAVRSADVAQAPVRLTVTGDIPAGRPSSVVLSRGTAQRIMTGAPLPTGADAVVRVEWTDGGTAEVLIERPAPVGQDVRKVGEDVPEGAIIAGLGASVTAGLIGASAAVGVDRLTVHRRPRVVIASTGDELVTSGTVLGAGMIYESNSRMLAPMVRQAGAEVVEVTTLTDNVDEAVENLLAWTSRSDVIVTTGGVSAGAFEVVKQAFERIGSVRFVKVAVQPGKPQGFGSLAATPVIALPGNPVSAFVSFELFVRPALRYLGGHKVIDRPTAVMVLTESLRRSPERHRYVPARADLSTGTVTPSGRQGSHMVTALADTNALIGVPAGSDVVAAGSVCEVLLLL
ncbi:MAG: gephyrin-like molybdotransferase Glp [Actinomycetes bacterium]